MGAHCRSHQAGLSCFSDSLNPSSPAHRSIRAGVRGFMVFTFLEKIYCYRGHRHGFQENTQRFSSFQTHKLEGQHCGTEGWVTVCHSTAHIDTASIPGCSTTLPIQPPANSAWKAAENCLNTWDPAPMLGMQMVF